MDLWTPGVQGPGVACAGPGRRGKRLGRGKGPSEARDGQRVHGQGSGGDGGAGGAPSWWPPEASRKLELVEPRLPRTRTRSGSGPTGPATSQFRAPGAVLSAVFPSLGRGRGLRPRANRCGAAAARGPGGGGGAGGWAVRAPSLSAVGRGGRSYLRVPGARGAAGDVQLMFDPSRDLCLRLAPRGCPASANLAFVQGGPGHTQGRKRGEVALRACPRPSPPISPIPGPSSPHHP